MFPGPSKVWGKQDDREAMQSVKTLAVGRGSGDCLFVRDGYHDWTGNHSH